LAWQFRRGFNGGDDANLLKALDEKPEEARLIYSNLVAKGNAEAQFKLGVMDLKENPAQAFENIEKAARQGHPQAINQLGMLYEGGQGVEQSDENAFICFEKVADQIPNAKTYLGYFYYRGQYVQQNDVMAFNCFKDAKDSDPNAANLLGVMYFLGRGGVQINYSTACSLFFSAAKEKNPSALGNLGMMYLQGLGVDKDISIAMQYFKEAANQNDGFALFELIDVSEKNPDMMEKDPQARGYYSMAADRGDARANCKVGQWYGDASVRSGAELLPGREKAVGSDLRIGVSLSMSYLEKAAKQGNSQAMHMLGDIYFYGKGLSPDALLATQYYLNAARLEDKTVMPNLRALSSLYQNGQRYRKAFRCSFMAAELGDDHSLYDLRRIEMHENLDKKSRRRFLAYVENACRLKNPHALYIYHYLGKDHLDLAEDKRLLASQRFLGDFYSQNSSGIFGTSEEYANALFYYQAILEQDPSVVPKLAKLYKDGWSTLTASIKPDGFKALEYYQSAVEKKCMDVAEAYENIAEIYENGIGGVEKNVNLATGYKARAEAVKREKNAQLN